MVVDLKAQLLMGVEAHRAGRLAEAEAAYRRVLAADAKDPDALNLLGVVAAATERSEEALALYDRALAVNARFAEAHYNKGATLRAIGRPDAAIAAFTQAIALNARYADAYVNLGTTYAAVGDRNRARETFVAMSQAFPQDARAFYNLGLCLARDKRAAEAKVALTTAVGLQPQSIEIEVALADANADLGDAPAAIANLRRALQLDPDATDVHDRLPGLLVKAGQPQDAIAAYDAAIALAIAAGDARRRSVRFAGLGDAYRSVGDWVQAISSYERAMLGVGPAPELLHNIAEMLAEREWMAAAGVVAEDAVRLAPDDHRFMHNLALFDLKRGQLASGWEKYEARIKANKAVEPYPQPRWSGEDLSGRRILVWPEQGIGDQILYSGLLPDVIARRGKVVIEVEPRLAAIMARSFPQADVVTGKAEGTAAIPEPIDYQVPMGSLPRILRRDFRQFPKHHGYLKADPARTAALRQRYAAIAGGRRIVGISWRSRNTQFGTAKSVALTDLAEILRVPGVMFVNLQYGDCADEIATAKRDLGVDILHDTEIDSLRSLEDFFAQVAAMDLVVTVSNTTVHAAGALNVPAWLLLPRGEGALWYWFVDREDSPWYPSVRLFRQPDTPDEPSWPRDVVRRAGEDLQRWSRLPAGTPSGSAPNPAGA